MKERKVTFYLLQRQTINVFHPTTLSLGPIMMFLCMEALLECGCLCRAGH